LNWMLARVSPSAEEYGTKPLQDELTRLEAALPPPRRGIALASGTAESARVAIRGNPNKPGEAVAARFLGVLGGDLPTGGNDRLELARRVLAPTNPLTPRVLVNRIWQHHFGEGLVRSVDNFGVMGESPTHPELLDYLASEFVRGGWSMKRLHRLLVLSSAYRMASRADDARAERDDPQNRLLHRMSIRRLEAEVVRDTILAVSGRLDRRMGGPAVPPHLTPFMQGRGRPAASGPLDGDGRRSVYLNVRRNFLNPLLQAFDYPTPFTTMGRRGTSTVPAQALTLLNNPFVIQQGRTWAGLVAGRPEPTPRERVRRMYLTAFGRPPAADEVEAALAFLGEPGLRTADSWTELCHVLFNVKEFVFVP
jgi:hypothetical protein